MEIFINTKTHKYNELDQFFHMEVEKLCPVYPKAMHLSPIIHHVVQDLDALCDSLFRHDSPLGYLFSSQVWKKSTSSSRIDMCSSNLLSSLVTCRNSVMYLTTVLLLFKTGEGFILVSSTDILVDLPKKIRGYTRGLGRRAVPTRRGVLRFPCCCHPFQLLASLTFSTLVVTVVK